MEIIIEHSNTKRNISGYFNLCGKREDLREIAHQILNQTEEDFYHGWIKIRKEQKSIIGIMPIKWD
jgi:hypothetical protein